MTDQPESKENPDSPDTGVQVAIDWSTEPAPVHSNVTTVNVQQASDMFNLVFSDVSWSADRVVVRDGKKLLRARIVASVRMHASSAFPFIAGLAGHWNRLATQAFENTGTVLPKFKLINADQQLDGLTEDEQK
jgi:hypothetical protein